MTDVHSQYIFINESSNSYLLITTQQQCFTIHICDLLEPIFPYVCHVHNTYPLIVSILRPTTYHEMNHCCCCGCKPDCHATVQHSQLPPTATEYHHNVIKITQCTDCICAPCRLEQYHHQPIQYIDHTNHSCHNQEHWWCK